MSGWGGVPACRSARERGFPARGEVVPDPAVGERRVYLQVKHRRLVRDESQLRPSQRTIA